MSRPATRSLLALSLAAVLGLGLAACSGGETEEEQNTGRPTTSELSTFFATGSEATGLTAMDQEMADCWAPFFADSDLSDVTLRAMVDEDMSYEPEDAAEQDVLAEVYTEAALECGMPTNKELPSEDATGQEQPSEEATTEEQPSQDASSEAEPSESASE